LFHVEGLYIINIFTTFKGEIYFSVKKKALPYKSHKFDVFGLVIGLLSRESW